MIIGNRSFIGLVVVSGDICEYDFVLSVFFVFKGNLAEDWVLNFNISLNSVDVSIGMYVDFDLAVSVVVKCLCFVWPVDMSTS